MRASQRVLRKRRVVTFRRDNGGCLASMVVPGRELKDRQAFVLEGANLLRCLISSEDEDLNGV